MRLLLPLLLLLAGCSTWQPEHLEPYPNPFGPDQAGWAPQPPRDNPQEIAVVGHRAFVTLPGSPDAPGSEIAVVNLHSGEVGRIAVGHSPTGLAAHPSGRFVLVTNRFSNYISVIDVGLEVEVQRLPADFYATELVFSPDGRELWISNRWRDAVAVWELEETGDGLDVVGRFEPGIPVGTNPRDLAMSAHGTTVAVASLTGLTVSILDTATRTERHRLELGAPANDVLFVGDHLVVATTSASTHHHAFAGPDTDGDGLPGDGTPNINFSDLQNELAVFHLATGELLHRYTSDTICCRDYRDVHPDDAARLGELLPPEDTWIVGGSLPEQLAWAHDRLWVTYSASNELQSFTLDPQTGALSPGPTLDAGGHNPHGIAGTEAGLLVAHRLGETVGLLDSDGAFDRSIPVGDLSGGPFPATDAEIGELFNFVTAPFTVDGDGSCTHCHREGGNIDKAFSMPLTRRVGVGLRQTMAYRGAADSRPWFFESGMDETNFVPVMNEFARIENFCCSDYTLWPDGAPAGCASSPPAECSSEGNPGSIDGAVATRPYDHAPPRPTAQATRDAFYEARIQALIGRAESFGDGLFWEDPISGERRPLDLDFAGITRALGLFLLQEPGLLPNPNDPDRGAVRRGEALFHSAATNCAACHPAPSFSLSTSTRSDAGLPLVMRPVVTPFRDEDGTNLDLFARGFVDLFPAVEQDTCEDVCGDACLQDPDGCDDLRDVAFGVPPLRGIWDRADGMLHHGRARGLREVLCTPGHPALGPGEAGFNEVDGIPDSHGGTSHLAPGDIDDLIAFLETL